MDMYCIYKFMDIKKIYGYIYKFTLKYYQKLRSSSNRMRHFLLSCVIRISI